MHIYLRRYNALKMIVLSIFSAKIEKYYFDLDASAFSNHGNMCFNVICIAANNEQKPLHLLLSLITGYVSVLMVCIKTIKRINCCV